jgi:hypothetical protein
MELTATDLSEEEGTSNGFVSREETLEGITAKYEGGGIGCADDDAVINEVANDGGGCGGGRECERNTEEIFFFTGRFVPETITGPT